MSRRFEQMISDTRRGILAGLTFFCLLLPITAFGIERGELPPNFRLTSSRGGEVELSDYKGKVVLVDFWASWCSTCKQSLKRLQELRKTLGDDKVQIVTVNLDDDIEEAKAFMQRTNLDLLVAFDPSGATPEAYRIEATPTSVLIGKDGTVQLVHKGGLSDATLMKFRNKIEALAGS